VCQAIEFAQRFLFLRRGKFFQIALAKSLPCGWTLVKPFAKSIRGSQIAQPGIDGSAFFWESPRPETINEYANPIVFGRFLVDAFDGHFHDRALLYHCTSGIQGMD